MRRLLLAANLLCVCFACIIPTIPAWSGVWTLPKPQTRPIVERATRSRSIQQGRAKYPAARICRRKCPGLLSMKASGRLSDVEETLLDDLLCQRAVQNQLYYFQEFRDGFKRQWLEHFLGHEGIYTFHGFGGLQCPAVEYLSTMMASPPESHEVKMSWGNRYTGGSKDNPYLQNHQRFQTYEETVHPQKICKGIMDIREQIAKEWLEDIDFVKTEDAIFWYDLEMVQEQEIQRPKNNLNSDEEDPHMEERDTLFGVNIAGNYRSTPLRKRTFDILKKKTLARYREEDNDCEDWFRSFWESEWKDLMEKDGRDGVAEDFLRTLVQMPSRAAEGKVEGTLRMINPADIAREVIEERQEVLEGWTEWLESGEYRNRHTEIQRELLLRSLSDSDEFSGKTETQ